MGLHIPCIIPFQTSQPSTVFVFGQLNNCSLPSIIARPFFFFPFLLLIPTFILKRSPGSLRLGPLQLGGGGQRRCASSDRWGRRPQAAEVRRGRGPGRAAGLGCGQRRTSVHAPCVHARTSPPPLFPSSPSPSPSLPFPFHTLQHSLPQKLPGSSCHRRSENMRRLVWTIADRHHGHLNVDGCGRDAGAMDSRGVHLD